MTIPVGGFDPQYKTQYMDGVSGTPDAGTPVVPGNSGDTVPPPVVPNDEGGNTPPTLPPASKPVYELDLEGMWFMTASLGANVLAMCKETLNEQRQAAQESKNAESQIVIKTLDEQAKTIRKQAFSNLMWSIGSGLMQIASGMVSVAGGVKGMKAALGGGENGGQLAQAINTKFAGFTQAITGLNTIMGGAKEFMSAGFDAEMKLLDKKIEMARANISTLESVIDKLKEVIRDANQNQSSLASQNAETLKKILA